MIIGIQYTFHIPGRIEGLGFATSARHQPCCQEHNRPDHIFSECFIHRLSSFFQSYHVSLVPRYIFPARTTLAARPAIVARRAPGSVYRVFVIFAVIKYTLMV